VEVTPDGSPVAVYLALPAAGEPELIHGAIPAGSSVLELASGPGRIATPLARLGHAVVAVDDSPAMLAGLDPVVEGVLGDAATVRLGRTFDVVLLASHLLNDPDPSGFLATAAAHLTVGGRIVGEVYPADMDWAAAVGRTSTLGPVDITVTRAARDGDLVDAEVAYRLGEREWRQPFVARQRDEADLRSLLAGAGSRFDRWLARPGWFVAGRER
jgi:SAM-dependent methyltransferase